MAKEVAFPDQILCGDCIEVMKTFPDESIDFVVTDPPYGYSFMGKDWDKAVPSVEVWKECLRVLKSGAFAFVMSSPRQDVLSQMIVRLGQAGFEMGFTSIYWCYASGFPKAMNISKVVDKRLGEERRIAGNRTSAYGSEPIDTELKSRSDGKGGTGLWQGKASKTVNLKDGVPLSKEARILDGSYGGFQPKPAVEVILVAMKPLCEKTFVDQALANGKGVTWLDDARIPFENNKAKSDIAKRYDSPLTDITNNSYKEGYRVQGVAVGRYSYDKIKGRFPANMLVSDDVLNDGQERKSPSGYVNRKAKDGSVFNTESCGIDNLENHDSGYGDSGSFSRYFDLDKWFSKTVESLPEGVRKTFPFLICPKASKSERNQGLENLPEKERSYMSNANGTAETWHPIDNNTGKQRDRFKVVSHNIHPTVKPLKLMSYLVTLGSRPRDVVLDPFCGSGTTCLASEILNRRWIGIDISPEYCEIAKKRLSVIPEKITSFFNSCS